NFSVSTFTGDFSGDYRSHRYFPMVSTWPQLHSFLEPVLNLQRLIAGAVTSPDLVTSSSDQEGRLADSRRWFERAAFSPRARVSIEVAVVPTAGHIPPPLAALSHLR